MNSQQWDGKVAEQAANVVRHLAACPFCAGPPVPIATRALHPYGQVDDSHLGGTEPLHVRAFVFCHECGAEGEDAEGECLDRCDVNKLIAAACDSWNRRDQRHAELYQAGEEEGLNQWPRADGEG